MTEISLFSLLGRIVPSLGLIVGGLLLVRWWSQRSGNGRAETIKVTSRTGLARNAQVAIVEVGAQRFLLGLTERNISLIAELDQPVVQPVEQPADATIDLTSPALALATGTPTDREQPQLEGPSGLAIDITTPRTGLVHRLQRATQRSSGGTSWQRVDDDLLTS